MKQTRIVFSKQYRPSPVSYWVHHHLDNDVWAYAKQFAPPLPRPVPGKGWPCLEVEVDGIHLQFASTAEIDHVIDVLSRNPLPTTRKLSEERGTSLGPNQHWLSRLPAQAKSLKFRQKLVGYLNEVRDRLENAA